MRRFTALLVLLVVVGLLGVTGLQSGRSQETASPTVGALEGSPESEFEGFLSERLGGYKSIEARGLNQVLQRHTYEPGGYVAPHIRPGETIYYIESGTLQFTLLDGEAQIEHIVAATPSGTPNPVETITPGMEITINAGDTIYFDTSALQTIRNDSDEVAIAYSSNLRGVGTPTRLTAEEIATPAATPAP